MKHHLPQPNVNFMLIPSQHIKQNMVSSATAMSTISDPSSIQKATTREPEEKEDDEDDYMSMTIADPTPTTKVETLTQRRLRKQREAEARAHPKSKAELAAEAEKQRQDALATKLSEQSKGAKMMAKLGYKPGSALGVATNVNARVEPIGVEVKEGREGIGALSEKKRKFREEVEKAEEGEKRRKEDEGGYRERVAKERDEKRCEGMWWGAMKVLEGLVEDQGREEDPRVGLAEKRVHNNGTGAYSGRKAPLPYRPLVRDRQEKEKEKRRRYDLMQSLSRNTIYDDPDEDAHDRLALGKEVEDLEDEEEVDEELQEYVQLPTTERLERVLKELRDEWNYCFWCKYRYGNREEMEQDCPGETEDEHG